MQYNNLRIGIFTITDAINFGAFYQMFAMAKYLENNGANVTIFHGKNSSKRILIKYFTPNIKRQIKKLRMLNYFERDAKDLDIRRYNNEHLDIAILGSDEIWNLDNDSFDHFEYYYGAGISTKKTIAYAPSIGFAKPENLINSKSFAAGLMKIDRILARDKTTKSIGEQITGRNVDMVVDPTVLFNDWKSIKLKASNIKYEYILYYGYTSSPVFLKNLLKFAKKHQLPIISAGYNTHSWADKNITCGPMEFLVLLKNAKYVFTSTFHGTVMASLYNKNLCYYASGQKVKDFGEKFQIESQHIDELSSIEDIEKAIVSKTPDFNLLLNTHMNSSRELLDKAIFPDS